MLNLLRGKSDWKRINVKTEEIVWYPSEHIDISIDCSDSVKMDQSKYVKRKILLA